MGTERAVGGGGETREEVENTARGADLEPFVSTLGIQVCSARGTGRAKVRVYVSPLKSKQSKP